MDRGNLDFVLSLDMLGFFKRHVLLYGLPPAKHSLIIDTSNTRDIKILFEEKPKDLEWEAIQSDKNFFEADGKEIISKGQFLELLEESSKTIDTELFISMQKSHSLDFKIVQLMALIDTGALSYFENKWPITEANFEACKSSIYPIRCLQWIGENLLSKDVENSHANNKISAEPAKLPQPMESTKLKWRGKQATLYFLLSRLYRMQVGNKDHDSFITSSWNDIAQFVYEHVDMPTKPEKLTGIISQLKGAGEIANSKQKVKINSILEEMELLEKLMRDAGIE